MPELPDLAVFAANIEKRFKNKILSTIEVTVAKKLNVSEKELKDALEGQKLEKVSREGKTMQLHFKNAAVLGLHLMLHGEIRGLDEENVRFQIVSFHFEGGDGFALCDFQKQATPTLNPAAAEVPDALAMTPGYFEDLLASKKVQIKVLLMDQKLIRGIGNTYADEILWAAKVSPFSISRAIPQPVVKRLLAMVKEVLENEVILISKKLTVELNGEIKDFLNVHRPGLKKSPTGAEIKIGKNGARKTYYTDEQELFE